MARPQRFENLGEPGGGRTRDHLIKSQVLYQLSYRLSQERRNLVADSAAVNADKVAVQVFHKAGPNLLK